MSYSSDELELQAILYIKGHYKKDTNFSGFKKIISLFTGTGLEFIDDDYMLHFSLMLLEKYGPPNLTKENFILELFRRLQWYKGKKDNASKVDIVDEIFSIIRFVGVKDLPPLPEADASIWELKNRVSASQLTNLAFPNCAHNCAAVEHLGVCECDSICPFKFNFTKDQHSTSVSQEDLDKLSDSVKQLPRNLFMIGSDNE
jgi:hypothetical protein